MTHVDARMRSTLFCLFLFAVFSISQVALSKSIDKILAQADDEIVLESDVERRIATIRFDWQGRGTTLPSDDELKSQIIDRLIVEKAELSLAKRAGVRVDENLLSRSLDDVANEYAEKAGKQETLNAREQHKNALALAGIDYEAYVNDIKEDLMINALRQGEINRRINLNDENIQVIQEKILAEVDANRRYHLSHILLPLPQDASKKERANAEKLASDIIEAYQSGDEFPTLAIAHSKASDALKGGNLGIRTLNDMPTLFVETAKTMQAGDISPVIKSERGLHIIHVAKIDASKTIPKVNETHVRHILLGIGPLQTEASQIRKLQTIRGDILSKSLSFADAAKQFSDDTGSQQMGGDLGFVQPAALTPEFAAMMERTPIGQISEPFTTQYGIHILEVIERRETINRENWALGQARRVAYQKQYQTALDQWLQTVKAESYIKRFD